MLQDQAQIIEQIQSQSSIPSMLVEWPVGCMIQLLIIYHAHPASHKTRNANDGNQERAILAVASQCCSSNKRSVFLFRTDAGIMKTTNETAETSYQSTAYSLWHTNYVVIEQILVGKRPESLTPIAGYCGHKQQQDVSIQLVH